MKDNSSVLSADNRQNGTPCALLVPAADSYETPGRLFAALDALDRSLAEILGELTGVHEPGSTVDQCVRCWLGGLLALHVLIDAGYEPCPDQLPGLTPDDRRAALREVLASVRDTSRLMTSLSRQLACSLPLLPIIPTFNRLAADPARPEWRPTGADGVAAFYRRWPVWESFDFSRLTPMMLGDLFSRLTLNGSQPLDLLGMLYARDYPELHAETGALLAADPGQRALVFDPTLQSAAPLCGFLEQLLHTRCVAAPGEWCTAATQLAQQHLYGFGTTRLQLHMAALAVQMSLYVLQPGRRGIPQPMPSLVDSNFTVDSVFGSLSPGALEIRLLAPDFVTGLLPSTGYHHYRMLARFFGGSFRLTMLQQRRPMRIDRNAPGDTGSMHQRGFESFSIRPLLPHTLPLSAQGACRYAVSMNLLAR